MKSELIISINFLISGSWIWVYSCLRHISNGYVMQYDVKYWNVNNWIAYVWNLWEIVLALNHDTEGWFIL